MRSLGISSVVRGKKVVTTPPHTPMRCPYDKVNRLIVEQTTPGKPERLTVLTGFPLVTAPMSAALASASRAAVQRNVTWM